jgi:hypothetical protein
MTLASLERSRNRLPSYRRCHFRVSRGRVPPEANRFVRAISQCDGVCDQVECAVNAQSSFAMAVVRFHIDLLSRSPG